MRYKKLLSIDDIEKIYDKLHEPNEGVYAPMLFDALEKLVEKRVGEENKKWKCPRCACNTCCNCWAGVR